MKNKDPVMKFIPDREKEKEKERGVDIIHKDVHMSIYLYQPKTEFLSLCVSLCVCGLS